MINIAFCNGSSRATRIVREFCEKNLHPILGRDAIREIYMDSEYTSFPVIDYFVVDEFSQVDVIMCMKRNKRVDQMMREVVSEAQWADFGKEEIAGKHFELNNLAKVLHLVRTVCRGGYLDASPRRIVGTRTRIASHAPITETSCFGAVAFLI